jgi:hypothetical protein
MGACVLPYTVLCERYRARGSRVRTADGDRNEEPSNANKSFADHRVTGDPPRSSPRRSVKGADGLTRPAALGGHTPFQGRGVETA